jgi:hypothetical protein
MTSLYAFIIMHPDVLSRLLHSGVIVLIYKIFTISLFDFLSNHQLCSPY